MMSAAQKINNNKELRKCSFYPNVFGFFFIKATEKAIREKSKYCYMAWSII